MLSLEQLVIVIAILGFRYNLALRHFLFRFPAT